MTATTFSNLAEPSPCSIDLSVALVMPARSATICAVSSRTFRHLVMFAPRASKSALSSRVCVAIQLPF